MNQSVLLRADEYQRTIYLNDNPYEAMDVGEGDCHVVLVKNIDNYLGSNKFVGKCCRFILVDISYVIKQNSHNMVEVENILINDLHLLLDVFWLDEVHISCEVKYLNMTKLFELAKYRTCRLNMID